MSIIAITGFMASGKTTVARELGRQLHHEVVDLDEFVSKRLDLTPRQIIESEGEEKFRELETELLAKVLTQESAKVIALGGGTWTLERNRELLAQAGATTVWLDVPFEVCWRRIQAGGGSRPLAPTFTEAKRRYDERRSAYQLADVRIETEGERVEDLGLKIVATLRERSTK
jgi:shikimate kinase